MTRIAELKKGDVIEFIDHVNDQQLMQLAIVNSVQGVDDLAYGGTKWTAEVEKMNGDKIIIDNNWDFVKSNKPFSRKLNYSGDIAPVDTTPAHYKGEDNIDVIDFLYQQLSLDEFKGFMKGNMIKYPVRAGRKDNELEDIKKARDYADRLIEKLEG